MRCEAHDAFGLDDDEKQNVPWSRKKTGDGSAKPPMESGQVESGLAGRCGRFGSRGLNVSRAKPQAASGSRWLTQRGLLQAPCSGVATRRQVPVPNWILDLRNGSASRGGVSDADP